MMTSRLTTETKCKFNSKNGRTMEILAKKCFSFDLNRMEQCKHFWLYLCFQVEPFFFFFSIFTITYAYILWYHVSFMYAIRWIVFAGTWWNKIRTKTKNEMRKMNKKRNTNSKHKKKECLNGISVNKISYRVVFLPLRRISKLLAFPIFRWSFHVWLCTVQCRCNEWVRERVI